MQDEALNLTKKKRQGFAAKRRNEIIFLVSILAFPIIHKIIFYIGGNLTSFSLAFQQYDGDIGEFVWAENIFQNFKNVFEDLSKSVTLRAGMKNTLLLYVVDTFFGIPVALLCSYFVVKKVPGHGFFKVVFFLPSMVSSIVTVLMFKYFSEYALPEIFTMFGAKNFPLILSEYPYAFPMMIVYSQWVGFAGGIVLYVGSMSKTPDGVVEAAQIDGVSVMGELWHVTLPTVYPMLTVFLVTGVTAVFTGGGPVFTFHQYDAPSYCYTTGYFLYTKVMGDSASFATYPYPAAAGMLITAVAAPLTFLVKYILEHVGPTED